MRRRGLLAVVAVAAVGCSKGPPPPAPPARPPGPSFHADIVPYLEEHCAVDGCHGDHPTESVDLDLRRAAAHRQLVESPAEGRAGAPRVARGNPDASFLVAKLTGALRPGEGKTMPIDRDTGAPILPVPVDATFVETLRRWIAAGALDD